MATVVLERFPAFLLPSLLLKYVSTTEGFIPYEEDLQMVLSQTLSYLSGRSVHFRSILGLPLASFQFTPVLSFLFVPRSPFPSIFCVLHSLLLVLALFLISCPSFAVTLSPSPQSRARAIPLCRSFGKELRAKNVEAFSLICILLL